MATQLFFRSQGSGKSHRGRNDANKASSNVGWNQDVLETTRGGGVTGYTATSVTGPTSGIEATTGGIYYEWVSAPLAADATISGTITFNIWALESSMSANATVAVILERLDSTGAIVSTIVDSSFGTELGTSSAAKNWTASPTSTNMLEGDRIRARIYFDDATASTMANGFTLTANINGTSAAADGDSYFSLTETLSFHTTTPTGSVLYPLNDNSDLLNDTGHVFPTSGTNVDNLGGPAWSSPEVITADDGFNAGITTDAYTDFLTAQTFGFSIPAGHVIVGVEVKVQGQQGTATSKTYRLRLLDDNGNPYGTDKTFNITSASLFTQTVGGLADLWGTAALTEAMVEDAQFGVRLSIDSGISVSHNIDFISMRVYTALNGIAYKAWTSRGDGWDAAAVDTVAGFTSPIQLTKTNSGPAVEWFTPMLEAFTLTGLVQANIRGAVSVANTLGGRVEVAVCNSDGSGATVWAQGGHTNGNGVWSSTTEGTQVYTICGDSVAVTQGQRLRLRIYIDDYQAAMVASRVWTCYYNGPTPAASGDTYFTLPQSVSEYAPNPPKPTINRYPVVRAASY